MYIVMYISMYLLYKPRNYVNVYVKNGLLFDAEIFFCLLTCRNDRNEDVSERCVWCVYPLSNAFRGDV